MMVSVEPIVGGSDVERTEAGHQFAHKLWSLSNEGSVLNPVLPHLEGLDPFDAASRNHIAEVSDVPLICLQSVGNNPLPLLA